jgi:hypothetical protein
LEQSLAGFAAHYTMQAERDVHEGTAKTAVGPALVEREVRGPEFPPQATEELGENVEFF